MGRIILLSLAFVLFAASCSTAAPTDDLLEQVVIQQSCSNFSQYLPKMDLDNPADLPCSRPAPYNYERSLTMAIWNGTAWVRPPFVKNKPYATSVKDASKGKAVIWKLRHAPIKGVTPEMVRWMWNNMDKQVADPRDGKKWQMFQLLHPSDHVGVKWSSRDLNLLVPDAEGNVVPGNATKWVWSEIPASGCKVNSTYVECPANQPGYTCNSITAAQLKKIATLNISMMAEITSDTDETGLEVSAISMKYLFNIKDAGCLPVDLWRPFVEFRNVMYYPRNGSEMRVITTWNVGYPNGVAVIFNEPYLEPLWAGFTPGGKLWRLAVNYYVMHTLQEWAALPQWLPQVYKAETGNAPDYQCDQDDYDMTDPDNWDGFKQCCDEAKFDGYDIGKYFPDCNSIPPRPGPPPQIG
ncbi:hypothetical protein OEZ86_009279 [Tetradesmus obliquus]|nr:hypothetical protein OEZ86_009279 [Tetradesmus obliquus]